MMLKATQLPSCPIDKGEKETQKAAMVHKGEVEEKSENGQSTKCASSTVQEKVVVSATVSQSGPSQQICILAVCVCVTAASG